MEYDVVVAGGGMAGLTSAAYLAKAGYKVVLCEQQDKVGGLVNSFEYKGFTLDGGIRSIENSGIVFPMLRELGIQLEFTKSQVSLLVGNQRMDVQPEHFFDDYTSFMLQLFPNSGAEIEELVQQVATSMKYMDVLYGRDNPLFIDIKADPRYALSLIPWLFKYFQTIRKIGSFTEPIDEHMKKITSNQQLIDIFAQHFFYKTPAFFALSYFSLYLDYYYPLEGTGALPLAMKNYIEKMGGVVKTGCRIKRIDPARKLVETEDSKSFGYQYMVWAADGKTLYQQTDESNMEAGKAAVVARHRQLLQDKTGGDSIFTVYLFVDKPAVDLKDAVGTHLFYTPLMVGLSSEKCVAAKQAIWQNRMLVGTKEAVFRWAKIYLEATTFEISCPAMRNPALAPAGKSSLIVSTLFEYGIMKQVKEQGYYDEFKTYCEEIICQIIQEHLLKNTGCHVTEYFGSTPLTIEHYTGNTDGGITGWAFDNEPIPVESKLSKVASSINTVIPDVYQAGQWSFSPSGLPIAILTGKLAADAVVKKLDTKKGR